MYKVRISELESDGDGGLEHAREKEVACADMKAVGEELKHFQHRYGYRKGHQHWSLDDLQNDDRPGTFYLARVEREDGSIVRVNDPEMDELGLRVKLWGEE